MPDPDEGDTAEQESEKKKGKRRRGRVTIFPNWCKGCGLCVEFCPTQTLEQQSDGTVVVAYPEKCTACGWCEMHCPDFAIFVTEVSPEEVE